MPWRKLPNPFKGTYSKRSQTARPLGGIRHVFHGVQIESGMHGCCPAVLALAGQRFLSEDAPWLPLDQCSQRESCQCRYRHFPDRRTDRRRETDFGLPVRLHPEDRREGPGRRITDR